MSREQAADPDRSLAAQLAAASAAAEASGALQPIPTRVECLEDEGLVFVLRLVESLQRKPQTFTAAVAAPLANPFLPPEPALFVAELSDTHLLLLNKFKVIDGHALIVTRVFAEQDTPLQAADFAAVLTVLRGLGGLVFFNAGAVAGASQRHRHLQRVPWPLHEALAHWDPARWPGAARQRRHWPFSHAWCPLADAVTPERLRDDYEQLLAALGGGAYNDYNLLITSRWMLAVRRRHGAVEGLEVNALGFAGTLLLKSEAQRALLQRWRPLALLRAVVA